MIIVLKPDATEKEIEHVMDRVRELGLSPHLSKGQERTIIGVIGDDRLLANHPLRAIPGVEEVVPILAPWKLAGREFKKDDTIIDVSGVKVGSRKVAIMAGPCAVEKKELTLGIAQEVKAAGASILRGGAYKPRTSPYSFQGLGKEGLDFLAEAKRQTGLPVVSDATGKWELVAPRAKAAIAAGADGLLIEVHSTPECALCDGEESLKPSKFKELMKALKKIAEAVDREI